MRTTLLLSLCFATAALSCSHPQTAKPAEQVVAAPPPKDDGQPAKDGASGEEHAAALEQLKIAVLGPNPNIDKQASLRITLPDSPHWMRVRFWGVESLVGFRYGKGHHAIVGGFITHVPDNTVQGACGKSFEEYARPYIEGFDVELTVEEPQAFLWQKNEVVEVESVHAKIATLLAHDEYTAAFASYPAFDKTACLIVGVAIPFRGEEERAVAVRDRFVKEVFPKIIVTRKDEPKERY